MADSGKLFESILVAIMGSSLSLFMIRMGGETMDRLINGLIGAGVYSVSSEWQHGFDSSLINLFYIVCMLPCVLGLIVAYLITQSKTGVDTGQYISEGDFLQ